MEFPVDGNSCKNTVVFFLSFVCTLRIPAFYISGKKKLRVSRCLASLSLYHLRHNRWFCGPRILGRAGSLTSSLAHWDLRSPVESRAGGHPGALPAQALLTAALQATSSLSVPSLQCFRHSFHRKTVGLPEAWGGRWGARLGLLPGRVCLGPGGPQWSLRVAFSAGTAGRPSLVSR